MIRPDQHTDISRRSVLQLSGITIAGVAAAPATTARTRAPITFGVYRNYYQSFTAAVHGARGVRIYYDSENVFPATWPNHLPGAWATARLSAAPLTSGRPGWAGTWTGTESTSTTTRVFTTVTARSARRSCTSGWTRTWPRGARSPARSTRPSGCARPTVRSTPIGGTGSP